MIIFILINKYIKNKKYYKFKPQMTEGERLKQALGLSKFKFVVIQKIIDIPINVLVLTVNSRYPSVAITYSHIKNIMTTKIEKIVSGDLKTREYKLTPPMDITSFTRPVSGNTMLFIRDIAGEFFNNEKMFECKDNKIQEVKI